MSRAPQDPLAEVWSQMLEGAARELARFLLGPGAMGRSAGRKGRPGEFPRGLDRALPKAYLTLGVLRSAPRAVIEAAYRALAKDAHPDVGGSEARMRVLNAAIASIRKERRWKG